MPYYTRIAQSGPNSNTEGVLGYNSRTLLSMRSGEQVIAPSNLTDVSNSDNVVQATLNAMSQEMSAVQPSIRGLYGSTMPLQPYLPAGFWSSGRTLRISGCFLMIAQSSGYTDINVKVGLNYPNSVGNVETARTMPLQLTAPPNYYLPYYFEYYMICIGTTDPNQQYATFDTYGTTRYNFKMEQEFQNGMARGDANYWANIEPIAVSGGPNYNYFPGSIQMPEVETQDTQPYIELQSQNLEVRLRHIIVEQLI